MSKTFLGLTTAAVLGATLTLVAQEAKEAAAPSPDVIARMQPGKMHAKLEPLIGSFTMKGRWRSDPDATWETFEADVEREWILGERFVREEVKSEFMGEPFQGIGILGYDNVREEYTMMWIEDMSTGMWTATGQVEDGELVFEGENSDVMSGERDRWSKSVISLEEDSQRYQGWFKTPDGEEFLSMEMTAERE